MRFDLWHASSTAILILINARQQLGFVQPLEWSIAFTVSTVLVCTFQVPLLALVVALIAPRSNPIDPPRFGMYMYVSSSQMRYNLLSGSIPPSAFREPCIQTILYVACTVACQQW
jgi:hypothetical protein